MGRTLNLDEIEDRAAAATPGPWETRIGRGGPRNGDAAVWTAEPVEEACVSGHVRIADCGYRGLDADFIAHARTDVPALLAEIDRLRAVAFAAMGYLESEGGLGDEVARRALCAALAEWERPSAGVTATRATPTRAELLAALRRIAEHCWPRCGHSDTDDCRAHLEQWATDALRTLAREAQGDG